MGNRLTRRTFLGTTAGAAATAATWRYANAAAADDGPFALGVASFDPLADRVIIWTRARRRPRRFAGRSRATPAFASIVRTRHRVDHAPPRTSRCTSTSTGYSRPPRTGIGSYPAASTSPVGRTRTLPAPGAALDRLRVGVVTCAEWEFGFFGGYRVARRAGRPRRSARARRLHLRVRHELRRHPERPSPAAGRINRTHETVSLVDYRQRHRQYRTDAGLQKMHAVASR